MYLLIKYILPMMLLLFAIGNGCAGQATGSNPGVTFEFLPGGAFAVPAPLTIKQAKETDFQIWARYETHSFSLPIYYSYRLGYRINHKARLSLEMNHLKLYLQNLPNEIERFTITHGFNQIWLNYQHEKEHWNFIAGAGPVIAHPENTIRGLKLNEKMGIAQRGYYLSGITTQFALQRVFPLGKFFFLSLETKVNLAYAKIPVVNGSASVPVAAFHALAGIGFSL
jgi:hypothetical protein